MRRMIHNSKATSGIVALERLKCMMNEEKCKIDEDTMASIRRDVGNIILKYADIEPDDVDIKITIQSKSLRNYSVSS